MNTHGPLDFEALKRIVFDVTGCSSRSIDFRSRDEFCRNYEVSLGNGSSLRCDVFDTSVPSYVVATMRFIRDYSSIPVPRVLAFETENSALPGPYVLTEKTEGITLEAALPSLSTDEQDRIVATIAQWTLKLLNFRFPYIGSLYAGKEDSYVVGPIVRKRFFIDGRSLIPKIERGPFSSAREYLLACSQREIDCARTLGAQDASLAYRRDLEECRLQVEQSMSVMDALVRKCDGLDEDDPDLAPFSLDLHNLSPKDIIVSKDYPTQIIGVNGWDGICTMPLWQCGRLPKWLSASMADPNEATKVRLAAIFRHVVAIASEDGKQSPYVRALCDEGSVRCSLHDLCDYDAFKDGFLLRPALESIAATLPGSEDVDGLSALLDPSTVMGRVARISLMTTGPAGDALSLAFSQLTVKDSARSGIISEASFS